MTEFGKELIESAREALAIARGEAMPARTHIFDVPERRLAAEHRSSRLALRLALGGFALLIAAGALLWARFGEAMLVDSLALIRSCF